MNLIQIITILFVIFALYRVTDKFKKQELKLNEFFIWLIFWITLGVSFILPESLTKIANFFGIGRGTDFVLYITVVVIFYLIFRIFIRLEKLERNITKVVRKNTIEQAEKDYQEKN